MQAMQPAPHDSSDPLAGISVLERGWLSSNNVLLHGAPGEAGAWLIDSSHVNHAEQTVACVREALAGQPLAGIANTHLHSDHCGGNAALQRAFGLRARVPASLLQAVREWDEERLSYRATGQLCERFEAGGAIAAGDAIEVGGRRWEALAAPGHDPDSLMFFDAAHGVLLSADALWEQGFGVVFPEMDGEPGFDDVGAVLDAIAALPVKLVVPGHGAPFTDVEAALARSRSRLASFQAEPARHAKHGVKVLIKYHLMEVREQDEQDLLRWALATPLFTGVWQRHGRAVADSAEGWCALLVNELVGAGALRREGGRVVDA